MSEPTVRSATDLDVPLLDTIDRLSRTLLGIRLTIVYPTKSGWAESKAGAADPEPDFCRIMQRSPEGARHCRMCHVLLTVAAASSGVSEQRCHAGARVLVAPIRTDSEEAHAILSSCIFGGQKALESVRARARKLGADAEDAVAAFGRLSELPREKAALAHLVLRLAGEAGHEVLTRLRLQQELGERSRHQDVPSPAVTAFETAIAGLGTDPVGGVACAGAPHTVRLVARLIDERPYLPFSVNDLAAAARLTRNHFSTVFREHVGSSFSTYLAGRRMALAMKLLRDPRLNIGEVADRVGYDDPGYFARRFRSETGLSPRAWRNTHAAELAAGDPG